MRLLIIASVLGGKLLTVGTLLICLVCRSEFCRTFRSAIRPRTQSFHRSRNYRRFPERILPQSSEEAAFHLFFFRTLVDRFRKRPRSRTWPNSSSWGSWLRLSSFEKYSRQCWLRWNLRSFSAAGCPMSKEIHCLLASLQCPWPDFVWVFAVVSCDRLPLVLLMMKDFVIFEGTKGYSLKQLVIDFC